MHTISRHGDAVLDLLDPAILLELQASMLAHSGFDAAAAELATSIARLAGADRASIGILLTGGSVRIIAMSHGASVDARQEFSARIAAAMEEAIDQSAPVAYPQDEAQPRIVHAHAELARRHGGSVFSVPLPGKNGIEGALTLERHAEPAFDAGEQARCELLLRRLAPVLLLLRDGERSLGAHALSAMRQAGRRLRNPGGWRLKLAVAAAAPALAASFLLPLPYQVTAPVRLEGAVQRALTAPDDGYIQQVSARPGDMVKAGQVLAELAQQDLQLERSKIESELAQYEGGYGVALAQADRPTLIAYQAKADQARSRLELISHQIERARIVAPFDGVVISGDLTQSLGAPVQKGNPLLVVAPHDSYRLMVEVDERDIADVAAGAAGKIRLTALPDQAIPFAIERIAPVAVSRDGRHFFEAEGRLQSGSAVIRPGLEGIARVDALARPLAAMLGHRLHAWLRLSLWSLGWWT